MSVALRRALSIVLLLVGSLGLCCGIFPGVLLPMLFSAEIARVERLQPSSFAAFEDGAPGREVLIEGTLSPRSRTSPDGLIIYVRSVAGVDADGDRIWVEAERVQPPLLIALSGGLAQVRDGYGLNGGLPVVVEQDALRIEGLRAGDSVLAVGTLVQGQEGIELDADFVAVGTRQAYLDENRTAALFFSIFGWALIGAGAAMLIGGLAILVTGLMRPRGPSLTAP